jgi:pyruvate kinase
MENARTQMIATLGPASLNPTILKQLVEAGVDLFRVNLSHGDHESHRRAVSMAAETGIDVMIDLPGPKIRIVEATAPYPLKLAAGDRVYLATDRAMLPKASPGLVLPKGLSLSNAAVGSLVLIDDGNVELIIRGNNKGVIAAETRADAVIKDRKGVAFVDEVAEFPPLVEEDKRALKALRYSPFSFVAASFVRSAACVSELRNYLDKLKREAQIIAKIESPSGVKNIDEILDQADGIMVARGDLGVCTPLAALPLLQKQLVALAVYHRKKAIVATQMLESMTWNRRPTRAEVTDVANAVLDGADAVMLSGETAVGKYPVETVEVMADIIANAERAIRTGLRHVF